MKAIGYVRVSTAAQVERGASLEAQEAAIAAEVVRRGWSLAAVHRDAGVSGGSLRREGLSEALSALALGEGEALVVAKLDRHSRSLIDFSRLLEQARKGGWAIIALDLGVDTSTPAGELVANVMAAVAQWERRVIGERTKAALAQKRAQGVQLGAPPRVAPHLRAWMREQRAAGRTLAAIAEELNTAGVPTVRGGVRWHIETVRKLVRN